MSKSNNLSSAYASFLKSWDSKKAGAKPTDREFQLVQDLGMKAGTKVSFAISMMLREKGSTSPEIIAAVGTQQLVMAGTLAKAGKLVKVAVPSRNGHKVYAFKLGKVSAKKAKEVENPLTKAKAKTKAAGARKARVRVRVPEEAASAAQTPASEAGSTEQVATN